MARFRERFGLEDLGVGMGLRVPHYRHVLDRLPRVDFFEIISENFMVPGGRPRHHLRRFLAQYRVVQHGVSLGIGGPDPIDRDYLARLKILVHETKTPWVSDHFCWTGAGGAHVHDLLPLPYTRETIARLVDRARRVQDTLEVPFLLENTSSYLTYRSSALSEWEFIGEIADRADIGLLFDVNNVWVSAYNHRFDPVTFVRSVPHERIVQIHLASHTNLGTHIIDTHCGPVLEPVLDLYRLTIEQSGSVSTCIEWDEDIPPFPRLAEEVERARAERARALAARARGNTSVDEAAIRAALEATRLSSGAGSRGWQQGGPRETAASFVQRTVAGGEAGQ
ncbi:MAG TPA: DUF692 domain-containing protein [Polyangiaceae bacterium]